MSDKRSLTFKAIDEIDALGGTVLSGSDTLLMCRISGAHSFAYRITIAELKTALGL